MNEELMKEVIIYINDRTEGICVPEYCDVLIGIMDMLSKIVEAKKEEIGAN